jgi:hypothetical protein
VDIFRVQRTTGLTRPSTHCCSAIHLRATRPFSYYTASIPSAERLVCVSHSSRLFCSSFLPSRANYIRAQDRLNNEARYPYLTYPTIWILKGGYRSFFDVHSTLCEPEGYIAERDRDQRREMGRASSRLEPKNRFKNIKTGRANINLTEKLRNARANTTKSGGLDHGNST